MLSLQLCLTHSDNIFEFTSFQARKGVSGPLRPKGPELGVVIKNLQWLSVSVIRKY